MHVFVIHAYVKSFDKLCVYILIADNQEIKLLIWNPSFSLWASFVIGKQGQQWSG